MEVYLCGTEVAKFKKKCYSKAEKWAARISK